MTPPEFRMIRHPLARRTLQVVRVSRLSPHMQRVVLNGADLAGFRSPGPDDHIKLFFPNSQGHMVLPDMGPQGPVWPEGLEQSPARDYTPRAFDPQTLELTIDFVLHGEGPATRWAAQARPGTLLTIAGPRGSSILEGEAADGLVLAGDETALPAIGRWLEAAGTEAKIQVFVEIPEAADRQLLPAGPGVAIHWLERDGRPPGEALREALAGFPSDQDRHVYWVACDSDTTRQIRLDLEARGVPRPLIRAKGYWKREAGN